MLKKKVVKNKFLNNLTKRGEKHNSEKILLKCFKSIQKNQLKKNSKDIFKISLINASPFFQLKTLKKKKNSISIPFLLKKESKLFYGIKNIIKKVYSIRQLPFYKKLNVELIKTSNLKGDVIKNKRAIQENAFVNKKYARYRWF